mgnify:CR=1 FL=1
MKTLFRYLLIALGVYVGIKFLQVMSAGVTVTKAVSEVAADTIKAPIRTTSSILALGAFGWDVLTGKGVAQSWEIYKGTNENVWTK